MTTYTATRGRARVALAATFFAAAGVAWAIHHALSTAAALHGHTHRFGLVYSLGAATLLLQLLMCGLERPCRATRRQQRQLDHLNVAVLIPAYNEDEHLLVRCIASLGDQTRKPDHIVVVDDGSTTGNYGRVREWAHTEAARTGLTLTWVRTPNGGKRHAHGEAIRRTPDADIYMTVDSDAILDPHAIAEGLKPFTDPQVMSVAGIVLAANNTVNLLARITDFWFLTSQLVDRSSLSAAGCVLVNSGPLAFYRAHVVRENLDSYLGETLAGRQVGFSDDSMLTLYAKLAGKTVQQPSSFVFTAMPEKVGHHVRQYGRWMRGSTIRSLWRFRYLPVRSVAYWMHFVRWAQTGMSTILFGALFVWQPAVDHTVALSLLLVTVLIGYAQGLRYLTVRRSDEPAWSQLLTWLLAPAAVLWAFFVLRPIRWYAMATCLRTGWGTRAEVEVTLVAA